MCPVNNKRPIRCLLNSDMKMPGQSAAPVDNVHLYLSVFLLVKNMSSESGCLSSRWALWGMLHRLLNFFYFGFLVCINIDANSTYCMGVMRMK